MWSRRHVLFSLAISFISVFAVGFCFPHHANATTGINQELSFEGKIVNGSGINITDGTYNMEFKIYAGCTNEPTNNTGCSVDWTEDELVSASQGVVFTSGTFQVNLGAVTAFASSVNWNTYPLYLSLQIGSTSSCTPAGNFTTNCGGDGEMSPYILLTSTPYALNSNELGGLGASSFGQLSANQTWTGTNTFQPTTNISSVVVQQTSGASPSADIFDVETANASNVIQVTSTAANASAVNITARGSNNNIDLTTSTSGASIILSTPTVLIGSNSTSNTTQDLLQLNSNTTDSDTCASSTNQGGLYYNTSNNSLRVCEDAAWQDVITTQGLGIMLFGVVPDSGTNPGDLESLATAGVSGPCKVSWHNATSVTIQSCTVYSGGQKFEQTNTNVSLPAMTANQFTHLCYYNGSTSTGPITNLSTFFTTPSTTETANLPTFSATAPILCVATIQNNAVSSNVIAQVFDTRVFTISQKQFMQGTAALAPGWVVTPTSTNTQQVTTAPSSGSAIAGTVAAGSSSAWSSGGPNVIIVTGGPDEVETIAGATGAYNYIKTSGSGNPGYANTTTTASATLTLPNIYMGLAMTAFGACSTPSASTCQGSIFTQIMYME